LPFRSSKLFRKTIFPAGIYTDPSVLLYLMLRAHFGFYTCPLFHFPSLFFKKITKGNFSLMPSPHLLTSQRGQYECRQNWVQA